MKNKKTVIFFSCVILIIAISVGGFSGIQKYRLEKYKTNIFPIGENLENLPLEDTGMAVYAFDPTDKEKLVGVMDYVFVAVVNSVVGTTYEKVRNVEGKIKGTPYTNYKITVIENIKGNLEKNVEIPIRMLGGISIDEKSVENYGNDILKKAETYIILAYADKEGELYFSDPGASIIVPENISASEDKVGTTNVNSEDVIAIYKEAYENQDTSERKSTRYVSKYALS